MVDPGALSSHERAVLATWADDGDVPEGLADRVVAAFLAEQVDDHLDDGTQAVAPGARTTRPEGRGLRVVGIVAALAAAAAVMLMVRVLPRASAGVVDGQGRHGEQAARPRVSEPPRMEARQVAAADPGSPELDSLGARAATVLALHCSPCHDSTDLEGKPEALRVFDLDERQWWSTMSDAQLEEARLRVQELGDATDDERGHVAAFVAAQLRERAYAG